MKRAAQRSIVSALMILFLAGASQVLPQPKDTHQEKLPSEESVTIVRDKSGTVTKLTRSRDVVGDLFVESKTYVRLKMEVMEILPSETKLISTPVVVVEDGKIASVIQGSKERVLRIEVLPVIVAGKGIELRVSYKKEPEMKAAQQQTVMTRNSQPVIIELLEDTKANSRLAVKITPLVETKEAAKEYPDAVNELQFVRSFLIMNNDKLIARGGLSVKNAEGGVVPYFLVEGRGAFVLSFKPFEGAEAKGLVRGKIMRIKFGEDEFEWFSEVPILPEGLWLVWVRNNPSLKPSEAEKGFLCLDSKNGSAGILFGKDAWRTFFK